MVKSVAVTLSIIPVADQTNWPLSPIMVSALDNVVIVSTPLPAITALRPSPNTRMSSPPADASELVALTNTLLMKFNSPLSPSTTSTPLVLVTSSFDKPASTRLSPSPTIIVSTPVVLTTPSLVARRTALPLTYSITPLSPITSSAPLLVATWSLPKPAITILLPSISVILSSPPWSVAVDWISVITPAASKLISPLSPNTISLSLPALTISLSWPAITTLSPSPRFNVSIPPRVVSELTTLTRMLLT